MMLYKFTTRFLLVSTVVILTVTANCLPVQAGGIEPYISRYLRVSNCYLISTHKWTYLPILSRYSVRYVIYVNSKAMVKGCPWKQHFLLWQLNFKN